MTGKTLKAKYEATTKEPKFQREFWVPTVGVTAFSYTTELKAPAFFGDQYRHWISDEPLTGTGENLIYAVDPQSDTIAYEAKLLGNRKTEDAATNISIVAIVTSN